MPVTDPESLGPKGSGDFVAHYENGQLIGWTFHVPRCNGDFTWMLPDGHFLISSAVNFDVRERAHRQLQLIHEDPAAYGIDPARFN